jgi:hypothetical protein
LTKPERAERESRPAPVSLEEESRMKRYTLWLWLAIVFLFLNGAVHSVSLFIVPVAQNETERQLINLMANYKQDLGAGFHRTMAQLVTALSSCFTRVCFLAGLINMYLLRKGVAPDILKGVLKIHVVIFAVLFVIVTFFAFLLPIVMIGLVLLFLIIAILLMPKSLRNPTRAEQ